MTPIRLLICEDSAEIRELLRYQLEEYDITVVAGAKNCAECLHHAAGDRPDVILLDLGLPGEAIEDIPRLAECAPVVVFSGHRRHLWERECLDAGAAAYVEKDARPPALAAVIQAVCRV